MHSAPTVSTRPCTATRSATSFRVKEYIRVTRGASGLGTVDAGYPRPISVWGWGSFGAHGIDAALYSGSRCYFFSGKEYIRVTRADEGAGTVDNGYPKPISPNWGWGSFGSNGINAALNSGGPYAAIPAAGLGSNSNYFLYSPAQPVWSALAPRRIAPAPRPPGVHLVQPPAGSVGAHHRGHRYHRYQRLRVSAQRVFGQR